MYFFVCNTCTMHQINTFNLLSMVKSHSVDAWIIALLWIYLIGVTELSAVIQVNLVDFMIYYFRPENHFDTFGFCLQNHRVF